MERTTVAKQEWEVITTHVLDRHNDYIQIYARQQDGGWLLSDGGDTLADAAQSGCEVDTPRFQARLADALAALGVRQVRDALEIEASADTLGAQRHGCLGDGFKLGVCSLECFIAHGTKGYLAVRDTG